LRFYNICIKLWHKATKHLPIKANFWHTSNTFLANKCKFALKANL
jgi:hypothetical protein